MQIRLNLDPDHHKSIEYEESRGFQWILLEPNHPKFARSQQARRQDSMTGGGGINKFWGGTRSLFCVNSRGHGGTRNLSQSGSNKQGEEQKVKEIFRSKSEIQAFFRPKTGDL